MKSNSLRVATILAPYALNYVRTATTGIRGGDYLLVVKDNQPQLLEDIKMLFGDDWWLRGTFTQGSLSDQHGDRVHQWHIQASTLLEGYSSLPSLKQVLKLKREVTNKSN